MKWKLVRVKIKRISKKITINKVLLKFKNQFLKRIKQKSYKSLRVILELIKRIGLALITIGDFLILGFWNKIKPIRIWLKQMNSIRKRMIGRRQSRQVQEDNLYLGCSCKIWIRGRTWILQWEARTKVW